MTTQQLTGGLNGKESTQSAMPFASPSCDGSPAEFNDSKLSAMVDEMNPYILVRAIVAVYFQRVDQELKPGSDNKLHSTRLHRPKLIAEITSAWELCADLDPDEDLFPYHESYVIRKWIEFRKLPDARKIAWKNAFQL